MCFGDATKDIFKGVNKEAFGLDYVKGRDVILAFGTASNRGFVVTRCWPCREEACGTKVVEGARGSSSLEHGVPTVSI